MPFNSHYATKLIYILVRTLTSAAVAVSCLDEAPFEIGITLDLSGTEHSFGSSSGYFITTSTSKDSPLATTSECFGKRESDSLEQTLGGADTSHRANGTAEFADSN